MQSCDCAPIICFCAPHICNVEVERVGCAWDRCDHSIKIKKPFRLLLKLVHPDCRLSEWRFDFHSTRVSGEKTAAGQIVTSAPQTERAYLVGAPRCFWRIPAQFSGRACEVRNDTLDHPRNLSTHRPLAERISRATAAGSTRRAADPPGPIGTSTCKIVRSAAMCRRLSRCRWVLNLFALVPSPTANSRGRPAALRHQARHNRAARKSKSQT